MLGRRRASWYLLDCNTGRFEFRTGHFNEHSNTLPSLKIWRSLESTYKGFRWTPQSVHLIPKVKVWERRQKTLRVRQLKRKKQVKSYLAFDMLDILWHRIENTEKRIRAEEAEEREREKSEGRCAEAEVRNICSANVQSIYLYLSTADDKHTPLGPCHTRHFHTQYCDKKIFWWKDNFESQISTGKGKLLTKRNTR